ncbi:hypothetical protein CROQUDRAFT_87851 [Cronartium quercuum f. sp. fusiforme G11]|uniref:Uncharacterized protein n=1 Tax=Cronartium quercuum f. sp. fusiforme G11 TaxID=708437 RepID=A0A9P6NP09_9BASI|nr:hypothetical protein CROQUDRAFT_87851 [Cronartium quercuum f. sp. fusiforme G11]
MLAQHSQPSSPSLEEDIRALDSCPRPRSSGTSYQCISKADIASWLPPTQQALTPSSVSRGGAQLPDLPYHLKLNPPAPEDDGSDHNSPTNPPATLNPKTPCTQRVQDILGEAIMGNIETIFKEIALILKGLAVGGMKPSTQMATPLTSSPDALLATALVGVQAVKAKVNSLMLDAANQTAALTPIGITAPKNRIFAQVAKNGARRTEQMSNPTPKTPKPPLPPKLSELSLLQITPDSASYVEN